jgi:hypothetical protein
MVSDGQQGWLYEPDRNRVMVGAVAEIETPLPQEMLTEMQDAIQQVLDVSDVKLESEEEVIGRETYKLTVTPKEDAEKELFPGGGVATLWVDKEQWIILKATYQADAFGQGTMEVQSFELNTGLSDDLFTFVVPEGAKVVDVESQQVTHLTLDEAQAQAEFPLLVPEYIPGDATLVDVFKMGTSFGLHYDHSPLVSFTIIQGSDPADLLPGPDSLEGLYPSEDITVRGQDASALVDDVQGNTLLHWTGDGVTVMIAGHLSLDEALQVAESLK